MKIFTPDYLDSLVSEAGQSLRFRSHRNIHQSYQDPCQLLFNSIQENSYIRPHRHLLDPKSETLVAIRGIFSYVEFDQDGKIRTVVHFGTEKYAQEYGVNVGIQISPGIWHTVIAETSNSILLEVKPGPFRENLAKEFADWSPEEGGIDAQNYLLHIKSLIARST